MTFQRKTSASQIALLQKCPREYFIKYKQKIKAPSTTSMVKGSLNHSCVETFFKMNPKSCGFSLRNYEEGFMNHGMQTFNKVLVEPRTVFGKSQPSYKAELTQLCEDEFAVATEIADSKIIMQNFIKFYCMQFQQYGMKYNNLPQSFYMSRPKFSELEVNLPNFIGYIDAVIEKDDEVMLTDYKTSQIYRSGFSREYIQQLKLYAWAYYQLNDIIPDIGCIFYLRYGRECMIEFDKKNVVDEMGELINWFFDNTESNDIEDYPMNTKHQFCTNCESKNPNGFKSGGGCWYSSMCNKVLSIN